MQLRTTGMALSVLDEAGTPSAQLRARVLAEVGPSPLPPLAMPLRPERGALWRRAGIAAAIALVMFGADWFAHARSTPAPQQPVRYSYAMRSPSGQLVQFTGVEGSERVTVTMDGIQAAPEGRQYQVWAIRNDGWESGRLQHERKRLVARRLPVQAAARRGDRAHARARRRQPEALDPRDLPHEALERACPPRGCRCLTLAAAIPARYVGCTLPPRQGYQTEEWW